EKEKGKGKRGHSCFPLPRRKHECPFSLCSLCRSLPLARGRDPGNPLTVERGPRPGRAQGQLMTVTFAVATHVSVPAPPSSTASMATAAVAPRMLKVRLSLPLPPFTRPLKTPLLPAPRVTMADTVSLSFPPLALMSRRPFSTPA